MFCQKITRLLRQWRQPHHWAWSFSESSLMIKECYQKFLTRLWVVGMSRQEVLGSLSCCIPFLLDRIPQDTHNYSPDDKQFTKLHKSTTYTSSKTNPTTFYRCKSIPERTHQIHHHQQAWKSFWIRSFLHTSVLMLMDGWWDKIRSQKLFRPVLELVGSRKFPSLSQFVRSIAYMFASYPGLDNFLLQFYESLVSLKRHSHWPNCIRASEQIVERFIRHNECSNQNPSGISQIILYKLLDEAWGHEGYFKWLINLRLEYTRRRNALLGACEEYLPTKVITWHPPAAGMFVSITIVQTRTEILMLMIYRCGLQSIGINTRRQKRRRFLRLKTKSGKRLLIKELWLREEAGLWETGTTSSTLKCSSVAPMLQPVRRIWSKLSGDSASLSRPALV